MGPQGEEAYIALGSNLGDRRARDRCRAFAALAVLPATPARGALLPLRIGAAGRADGGDYLNAVARLRTTLAPLELLHALQAIEARGRGRERPYPTTRRARWTSICCSTASLRLAGDLALVLPHSRACTNVHSFSFRSPKSRRRSSSRRTVPSPT